MLNLSQRLILGCTLLAACAVALFILARPALIRAGDESLGIAISVGSTLLCLATILLVLHPIHGLARDIKKIAQGNLEHRVEWSSRDSFGVDRQRTESHRGPAARPARHRSRAAGRWSFSSPTRCCNPSLSPSSSPTAKGHLLKVNQAAAEILGEAATDRMALDQHPRRRQNPERHPRRHLDAEAGRRAKARRPCCPCASATSQRSYRLRTMPMRDSEGRLLGTVTTLEDVTTLQDTDRFKTQFIAVASRKLRDPLLQLRRGLYALGQGFGGELAASAGRAGRRGQPGVGEARTT